MRPFLALLILATLAPAPARAQEKPARLEALAELIHEALPRTSATQPDNSWDAVSIRISSLMHWHLAPPDTSGVKEIQRRGWLEVDGLQIGLTAHGDRERVTSLAFDRGDGYYSFEPAQDDRDFLAALTTRGVTISNIERRPYPADPAFPIANTIYTLSAEGREDARLTSSTHCTPPGSRAARRCWITHELILGD